MPIHIEAVKEQVADKVLLVGDPDRAAFISEKFLSDSVCYNRYRHLFGYTGFYKGQRVSVQTSGMGTPSLSIVVEELNMLGVKEIIRVGTCGTVNKNIKLGDTVIASLSHSSHDIYRREFPGASFSAGSDFEVTVKIYNYLKNIFDADRIHAGAVLCSETFYEDSFDLYKKFAEYGTLGVEMESYALFFLSLKYGIKAGTILTVSDLILGKERASKELIKESVERNTLASLECFAG